MKAKRFRRSSVSRRMTWLAVGNVEAYLVPADAANPQADSCGYTDLLPLDGNTFLLVYTWFNRPGADGRPRKSVLTRRITVTR